MRFLKKFNELSEFNLQRMNSDSVQVSSHVDNPGLSTNAFDRHQDKIRAGIARLSDMDSLFRGSNMYKQLRSTLSLDEQDIKTLFIQRILCREIGVYDVYIRFTIDDDEYWGVVKDIQSHSPEVKSEVFTDSDLYQPKTWIIKTKGVIINNIKAFLTISPSRYRVLTNLRGIDRKSGKFEIIERGSEIEVVRTNKNKIIIDFGGERYDLINNDYIYFNWWCERISN